MTIEKMFDLSGRVAVVTGASSGLGVLFAEVLRDAGATVVLAARREERLRAMCANEPRFDYVVCDVTNDASVQAATEQVLARHGGVDVLVNNAGTTWSGRAEHEPLAAFRSVMEANLVGAFHLTQRLDRRVPRRRRDRQEQAPDRSDLDQGHHERLRGDERSLVRVDSTRCSADAGDRPVPAGASRHPR